jgi:hypothetical protein
LLYVIVAAIGHLVWEIAQLPLYTIWWTGTARENFVAVVHCTGGDVFITTATLLIAALAARCRLHDIERVAERGSLAELVL